MRMGTPDDIHKVKWTSLAKTLFLLLPNCLAKAVTKYQRVYVCMQPKINFVIKKFASTLDGCGAKDLYSGKVHYCDILPTS